MVPIINPQHRVGIFLDVQNLYHSARNLYGSRVNYKELMRGIVMGRKMIRALAYVVTSDPTTGEGAFFDALLKEGIQLRNKELQVYQGGSKKADWDIGMAVDAIRLAPSLDVVVLVTGDGDFIPLVQYLRDGLGKIVEVAAFDKVTSSKLKEEVDGFIDLSKLNGVLFQSARSNRLVDYPKNYDRHYEDILDLGDEIVEDKGVKSNQPYIKNVEQKEVSLNQLSKNKTRERETHKKEILASVKDDVQKNKKTRKK